MGSDSPSVSRLEKPGRVSLSVRELPPGQRPRERLRALGAGALSLNELLSLIIGSGSGECSALQLADNVLASVHGQLRSLASAGPAELERVAGVGEATSARLLAGLELGRRLLTTIHPGRTTELLYSADRGHWWCCDHPNWLAGGLVDDGCSFERYVLGSEENLRKLCR